MSKVVVIYSGGVDSYTALMGAVADGHEVFALSVNYGQRHSVELEYAKRVCEDSIIHKIVDLSGLQELLSASALTSDAEMPHGHYEAENMKQTVVPNRNAILLSIAAGWAVSIGAKEVLTGVHAGDHYIYPDCRPDFVYAMNKAVRLGNEKHIRIVAPYLHKTKAQIMEEGKRMSLDYGNAWTCYDPQYAEDSSEAVACGQCGSCVERLEAVDLSGCVDSMEYVK